jgi:hypothetical protein
MGIDQRDRDEYHEERQPHLYKRDWTSESDLMWKRWSELAVKLRAARCSIDDRLEAAGAIEMAVMLHDHQDDSNQMRPQHAFYSAYLAAWKPEPPARRALIRWMDRLRVPPDARRWRWPWSRSD